MGDISAMNSIDRVIKKHGKELIKELKGDYPSKFIKEFTLENNVYGINTTAILIDGTTIPMIEYPIDDLADRYPDCDVGY